MEESENEIDEEFSDELSGFTTAGGDSKQSFGQDSNLVRSATEFSGSNSAVSHGTVQANTPGSEEEQPVFRDWVRQALHQLTDYEPDVVLSALLTANSTWELEQEAAVLLGSSPSVKRFCQDMWQRQHASQKQSPSLPTHQEFSEPLHSASRVGSGSVIGEPFFSSPAPQPATEPTDDSATQHQSTELHTVAAYFQLWDISDEDLLLYTEAVLQLEPDAREECLEVVQDSLAALGVSFEAMKNMVNAVGNGR